MKKLVLFATACAGVILIFALAAAAEDCIYGVGQSELVPCHADAGGCNTESCDSSYARGMCVPFFGTFACIRNTGYGNCCCFVYSSDSAYEDPNCRVGQGGKLQRSPAMKYQAAPEWDTLALLPGGCSGYAVTNAIQRGAALLPARRTTSRPPKRAPRRV